MEKLKGFIAGCDAKPSPVLHLADQGELVYDYSKRMPDKVSAKRTRTFTAVAQREVDEKDFSETIEALDKELESVPHGQALETRRGGGAEPGRPPASGVPKVIDEQKVLLAEVRSIKNTYAKVIDDSRKNL